MSLQRPNPLDVSVLGSIAGLDDQIKELWRRVSSANDARADFMAKAEKLLRQRRGVRKAKNFPWPGCNNHNWPLIDAIARRWKPGIASLVLQSDPICYFFAKTPEGVAAAAIAQDYYSWRFRDMTGVPETVMELCEYIFQYGMAYTIQGWEYETTKSCRLVRLKDMFPNGLQAEVDAINVQVQQVRDQATAAVQAGQAPPDVLAQIPPMTDPATLLFEKLSTEYMLSADNPLERKQLEDAVKAFLAGAEVVKFYYQIVRKDKPCWKAVDPTKVTVPPRCGDIPNADFIAIEHDMTADDILRAALDGHFELEQAQKVVTEMKSKAAGDPELQIGPGYIGTSSARSLVDIQDKADGIMPGSIEEPSTERIYEIYCKLDINDDGILERCRLWYHPGISDSRGQTRGQSGHRLALYALPYPFQEWPVVRFQFEHTSRRPYGSRGAAELLSVFQAQVNKLHNARLDAIQIVLSPMLVMRTTAGDEQRNIKFMPGAIIPVQTVGDVAPLQMDPTPLVHLLQEENVTKALAEQYVGVFDPGILAENAVERRTATEVEAVQQQVQSVFGQDAAMFQASMAQVHKQLWDLDEEFGPDEIFYRVMGDPRPRLCRRYEISYDYDIQPAGSPANTNQAFARKKALEAMQLFGSDATGLINKHALFTNYFNTTDRNLGKVLVRPPEEAAMFQQMQQVMMQAGMKPKEIAPPP